MQEAVLPTGAFFSLSCPKNVPPDGGKKNARGPLVRLRRSSGHGFAPSNVQKDTAYICLPSTCFLDQVERIYASFAVDADDIVSRHWADRSVGLRR